MEPAHRFIANPDVISISRPSLLLLMLESRVFLEIASFFAATPLYHTFPRGDGHTVLTLPGFLAGDWSTSGLRRFLRTCGYRAEPWNQGTNLGPRPEVEDTMRDQVRALVERDGRPISLVGWSLGGIYAREIAREMPDMIRMVVTLGSPFAMHPAHRNKTNVDWLYELLNPHDERDTEPGFFQRMQEPPPVPITCIYTKSDGVAPWQMCIERAGPQRENIVVPGSHCGLGCNPLALYAVADRLAQAEGQWQPFSRADHVASMMYGGAPARQH